MKFGSLGPIKLELHTAQPLDYLSQVTRIITSLMSTHYFGSPSRGGHARAGFARLMLLTYTYVTDEVTCDYMLFSYILSLFQ